MLQRRLLAVFWTPENPAAAHLSPVVKSLKNAFARSCFFISRLSPCYILATINVNVKSRTFPWFDVPATQNPSCRTLSIKYLDRSSASYSRGFACVVINEIMYHPASGNVLESYVELRNLDNVTTNISGWHFTKGIEFTFPTNTTLGAGAYLVVAADRTAFTNKYPGVL